MRRRLSEKTTPDDPPHPAWEQFHPLAKVVRNFLESQGDPLQELRLRQPPISIVEGPTSDGYKRFASYVDF